MSDVLIVINLVMLGILAMASIILVLFIAPLISELRKTVKTVQTMADNGITPLIIQVKQLVEETRPKIDNITQKIDSLVEDEVKPLTDNLNEITTKINEDMAKVDLMVNTVNDMVSRTHEVVSLYQDKAVIPVIEAVSMWDGIKKGFSVFFKRS
jgi:predicted PurR-regulated permease PerM